MPAGRPVCPGNPGTACRQPARHLRANRTILPATMTARAGRQTGRSRQPQHRMPATDTACADKPGHPAGTRDRPCRHAQGRLWASSTCQPAWAPHPALIFCVPARRCTRPCQQVMVPLWAGTVSLPSIASLHAWWRMALRRQADPGVWAGVHRVAGWRTLPCRQPGTGWPAPPRRLTAHTWTQFPHTPRPTMASFCTVPDYKKDGSLAQHTAQPA